MQLAPQHFFDTPIRIDTFQDALLWAQAVIVHSQQLAQSGLPQKQITYWQMKLIYGFAIQMVNESKIGAIQYSCLKRLPKTHMQRRSCFAVTMLLLSLIDPKTFNRHKRYRIDHALIAALQARVTLDEFPCWLETVGGIENILLKAATE